MAEKLCDVKGTGGIAEVTSEELLSASYSSHIDNAYVMLWGVGGTPSLLVNNIPQQYKHVESTNVGGTIVYFYVFELHNVDAFTTNAYGFVFKW